MKEKRNKEKSTVLVTIAVPQEIHEKLKQIAAMEERTIAATVRVAVRLFIEKYKKSNNDG